MPHDTTWPLELADLTTAVGLHERLLPHGFFVALGSRFMRRYYRGFVESPYACAVAVKHNDRVVGVLVGTLNHERHAAWTTRQLPTLALAGVVALAAHPRMLKPFLLTRLGRYSRALGRRVRHLRRVPTVVAGHRPPQVAVLSHLFVDPNHQGTGLGKRLLEAFVTTARTAGADRAELVTMANAAGAGAFYTALGWHQRDGEHCVDGHLIHTYVMELSPHYDST